jgi:hypothetical protein
MKNLVLENDCEIDIPEELQEILKFKFKEGRELWTQFKCAYWPENRKETLKRLSELTPEDNLICQTVFVDWQQLEILTNVLYDFKKLKKKINFYIHVAPGLNYHIKEYLDDYKSDICPDTEEYNDSPKLRDKFKKSMNKKMLSVLDYHNVYDLHRRCKYEEHFDEYCTRVTSETIKNFKL